MGTEPRRDAESLRGSRRSSTRRPLKRSGAGRRTFTSTLKALEELAASGAKVSVRITDLDRGTSVLAGDVRTEEDDAIDDGEKLLKKLKAEQDAKKKAEGG